jgi:hypothetical protein
MHCSRFLVYAVSTADLSLPPSNITNNFAIDSDMCTIIHEMAPTRTRRSDQPISVASTTSTSPIMRLPPIEQRVAAMSPHLVHAVDDPQV